MASGRTRRRQSPAHWFAPHSCPVVPVLDQRVAHDRRKRMSKARSSLRGCLCSRSAFAFDRPPADVMAVEFAVPGNARNFGVGLALGVLDAVAERAHAQYAT